MLKSMRLGNYRYILYRFVLVSLCKKFAKESCLTLDAGCGERGCSLSHIPETLNVVGIDLSHSNVRKSKRKMKNRDFSFVLGTLNQLPFKSETFGLVLCVDVLEHIETKDKTMKELCRVSKPNAHVIGSTTNLANPFLLVDSIAPRATRQLLEERYVGRTHYERHSRFTPASLTRALKRAGFKPQYIDLFGYPPFLAWIYHYTTKKPPLHANLWILFQKLTRRNPLKMLKETTVFAATKSDVPSGKAGQQSSSMA